MRNWQFWWNTIIAYSQYNPPRFVELMLLILAIGTIGLWGLTDKWPYLGLSLSYAIGSSTSILIGETIAPTSANPRLTRLTAVLALITSFYFFIDVIMGINLIRH